MKKKEIISIITEMIDEHVDLISGTLERKHWTYYSGGIAALQELKKRVKGQEQTN